MRDPTDRMKKFIEGLTELTKRTGLEVWACSCCESVNIRALAEDEKSGRYKLNLNADGDGASGVEWRKR